MVADNRVAISGSITAQNRDSEKDNSGFIFVKGKIYGIGGVYLGRPKGSHARVVFMRVYMSRTIVPMGWTRWRYDGSTE